MVLSRDVRSLFRTRRASDAVSLVQTLTTALSNARPPDMVRVSQGGASGSGNVSGVFSNVPRPSAAAVWSHREACVRQQKDLKLEKVSKLTEDGTSGKVLSDMARNTCLRGGWMRCA